FPERKVPGASYRRFFLNAPGAFLEALYPAIPIRSTECTHIIPSYQDEDMDDPRVKPLSSVWSTVQLFGGIPHTDCTGSGVHNLRNISTLRKDLHIVFESLAIWFEPIEGTENQYTVEASIDDLKQGLPAAVTFSSAFPDRLPPPDRRYLAIHAACAKVVLLSGATKRMISNQSAMHIYHSSPVHFGYIYAIRFQFWRNIDTDCNVGQAARRVWKVDAPVLGEVGREVGVFAEGL
ncbi:hypothetical protein BDV93DRAFT_569863, partial [Ceratobasidium sp. AG-I]